MSPRPLPPAPSEPLTPDERAWAERLALVGPHAGPDGGPSPALDARILAAAQAAVAVRPRQRASRRRWPTLVGAAASLVIVVGLAWQLQPLLRTRPPLNEGPATAAPIARSEGSLSADVLAAADPVARSAVDSPPPAPAPPLTTTPRKRISPPPAVVAASPARPSPAHRPAAFGDDAIPPYADYAGNAAAGQAASQAAADDASARTSTDERRERAAAQPFPAARGDAAEAAAMPAPPPPFAPAAPAARGAFAPPRDTSSRKATASPPQAEPAAQAEHDDTTLDRIEVTGTHITLADLPVRDDARLEPAVWLQRIRDRRDADDLDGARESLARFRQSHPRIRLPDDLARLGH
ncbi:MAG: hypothetical protein ACYC42_07510 [Lysobacter sp.]